MNLDPRDVILYVGLVLIGLGLWLLFEPGVALTTIGVMLFSVGVWTSRGHHHLLRLHCEPPGTRSDGPRLKRANEADTTECDGE